MASRLQAVECTHALNRQLSSGPREECPHLLGVFTAAVVDIGYGEQLDALLSQRRPNVSGTLTAEPDNGDLNVIVG